MSTPTCPHGFPQGTCLICQTLGGEPATAPRPSGRHDAGSVRVPPGEVEVLRSRRAGAPLSLRLLGGAVVLLVAAVGVWWVITLVWAVFHLLEIVAASAVFGYCGWRLGVHHGRRHPG